MAEAAQEREDEQLWKIDDLAAYLNLSKVNAYAIYRRIGIPFTKVGGALRFQPSEVKRWVRSQAVQRGA